MIMNIKSAISYTINMIQDGIARFMYSHQFNHVSYPGKMSASWISGIKYGYMVIRNN